VRRQLEGEAVCTVDDFGGRTGDGGREGVASGAAHRREAAPLATLLDALLAMQSDLAGDVMPRAARITGTSQLLQQVRVRLDAAIGTTRALMAADERRGSASAASMPAGSSNPATWSSEQEGLAAVHAARSVT
jgi:hypothetical protein